MARLEEESSGVKGRCVKQLGDIWRPFLPEVFFYSSTIIGTEEERLYQFYFPLLLVHLAESLQKS